ncbi:hypothetical protein [Mastigocoleus testarum]|uniref:Uncharacterized protein n=1 Tax=Mastigocoleus testarum BC008 TaxID=371196 RepID=A0A0V7ZZS7_9CYAN|nr:hypothetical protein [Mastigocoleus testarum]KST70026.1 hypothetical protein BC008_06190 [Mastigocoleus testarum BC008]
MIKQKIKIGLLSLLLASSSIYFACTPQKTTNAGTEKTANNVLTENITSAKVETTANPKVEKTANPGAENNIGAGIDKIATTRRGELKFISSWFGNTGGNRDTAGQSWIERIKVQPDGSVWSQTGWDESGNNNVIYKNGARVGKFQGKINPYEAKVRGRRWVIPNPKFLGGDRVQTVDGRCVIKDAGTPSALAVTNDRHLMVADNGPRQYIRIYDVSSPCNPKLIRTFGEEGGVFSKGKPAGVVEPLRFYGINGVGMDRAGNICVGGQIVGGGGWIRCLTPQGKLKWQVYSAGWLSNAAADPDTDGRIFYSSSAAYRMDYGVTKQGKEGGDFPVRFTIDIFRYPDDPRAKVYAGGKWLDLKEAPADGHYAVNPNGIVAVRSCGTGRKYLFGSGQNGPKLGAYKVDERGMFMPMELNNIEKAWAMNVDDKCNIWVGKEGKNDKGVLMYPFTGIDAQGNLQYREAKVIPRPFADMTTINRIHYDTKQDALYLTGYSKKYPHKEGWGLIGSVMYRWNGISKGKMDLHPGYPAVFPDIPHGKGSDSGAAPGEKTNVDIETSPRYKSISWAGNYAFTSYVARNKTKGGRRGHTDVYDLNTGKKVKSFFPDGNIMRTDDEVGWVDIINGNSAFLRSNGEYVVSVEDNAYNKYLLFRWCPSKKCN